MSAPTSIADQRTRSLAEFFRAGLDAERLAGNTLRSPAQWVQHIERLHDRATEFNARFGSTFGRWQFTDEIEDTYRRIMEAKQALYDKAGA